MSEDNSEVQSESAAIQGSIQDESHMKSVETKRNKWVVIGPVLGGGLAVAGLLTWLSAPTVLEKAVEACDLSYHSAISLDDDKKGLYLDGEGDESAGLAVSSTVCILGALNVPDSVLNRMSNTTSLMGQQDATWDGITALWTYHPNNGLDIVFNLD